jgi:hypothetical protein
MGYVSFDYRKMKYMGTTRLLRKDFTFTFQAQSLMPQYRNKYTEKFGLFRQTQK